MSGAGIDCSVVYVSGVKAVGTVVLCMSAVYMTWCGVGDEM